MKLFIERWYQVGGIILLFLIIFLFFKPEMNIVQFLLVLNFMALLTHQLEEYQFPGGAPLIINRVVYNEKKINGSLSRK